MEIKEAIDVLIKALKDDEEYYYSWQANIAMAFKDRLYYNVLDGRNVPICIVDERAAHEIANEAAKDFLNLLIRENGE